MSLLLPQRVEAADYRSASPYRSTTHAVIRYCELYELMSCPRSIPLGIHKTHVGKTDSRARWQQIQGELARFFCVFPKIETVEWWLVVVNQYTHMMPEARRRYLEERTNQSWSKYRFERHSAQAYRDLTIKLREAGLIPDEADGRTEEYEDAA